MSTELMRLPQTATRHALRSQTLAGSQALLLLFGVGTFALHFTTAGQYGYQRDELYFLACAKHLAWGYVDQPPMIAVIAKAAVLLFGQSLPALRLFPALAAAAIVVLTGRLAERLGGGPVAQAFAMLAVAVAPFYLAVGNLLTMNAFEPLLWTAAASLILSILRAYPVPRKRYWVALGATVALGILTKYTMGFFALSLCAALLFLPERRLMRNPGFWVSIALTLLLTAPNLMWQYSHAWPQIELLRSAVENKDVNLGAVNWMLSQILMVNPMTFPLWLAGLIFFSRTENGRLRVFSLSYVFLCVVYITLRAKVYYLAPIYPLLFSAGACKLERRLNAHPAWRASYAAAMLLLGALILPQVIPILPLPTFLRYQAFIDFRQIKEEDHTIGSVPQQYADMLGWDRMVLQTAQIYESLPPRQRARAAIWTENYGEAAAIDLLGKKYGLPEAISGHNTYYLWGPRGYDGSVVIAVGLPPSLTHALFGSVRRVGMFEDPYVMPYQNHVAIDVCTRPRMPLREFWPRAKAYY